MANELSLTAAFSFAKNGIQSFGRSVASLLVNVAGNGGMYDPGLAVSNIEAALPLGGLTSLGYAWFRNLDANNSITIKAANGGTKLTTLAPGAVAMFPFDSSVTAPTAVASAGTPLLEYAILPP